MDEKKMIYLKDYVKPEYLIKKIDLEFEILKDKTIVNSTMQIVKNIEGNADLKLNGKELKLEKIAINGKNLIKKDYIIEDELLTVKTNLEKFTLNIVTVIDPNNNTSLEGLYKSGTILCTQNESEGFRRITYFMDRPDVMSVYTTKITANKKDFPILLSNGNKIDLGDLEGNRHFVMWEDPFPKPSYLFALVAGDLDVLEDEFVTMSKRKIALSIFVDKGKTNRAKHAMVSLKKSMKWDENKFGLECDLDNYMIVSVDSFNAGAMENKGLNIFNSKYTLGDDQTATDEDLRGIESVIAHEYFHNWTGNRVTCRDWFQLTLKEGLTVFRDNEFSGDVNSEDVERINNVKMLRSSQFVEDSGPLSHPIRPEAYMEINNFYTATVYEKGQEVIRMIQTFIGKDAFRKGIDKYFELYDGQAVTTEDFLKAMEIASGQNFTQFKNWYSQAGTPICNIKSSYNKEKKIYKLTIVQEKAKNIKNTQKPFYFPLRVAFFDNDGKQLDIYGANESILTISKEKEVFTFENIGKKPIPSLLRGFSAPIILNYNYSISELITLFKYDSDAFNRFEASQRLIYHSLDKIMKAVKSNKKTPNLDDIYNAFSFVLDDKSLNSEFASKLLSIPMVGNILEKMEEFDVDVAFKAREIFVKELATKHEPKLLEVYKRFAKDKHSNESKFVARRFLKNKCLGLLSFLDGKYDKIALKQFENSQNMTDSIAALVCLNASQNKNLREKVLTDFYNKWKEDSVVINNWFKIQAFTQTGDVVKIIKKLSGNELFDIKNPNKLYSLYGSFTGNLPQFHNETGSGYELIADIVIKLDKINTHASAHIVKAFKKYSKLDENRKILMKKQIDRILNQKKCSKGVFESITKIIEE